ncbi:tRNA (pseudouridine(54)-N(1))-methyltransferase TrmY [Methanoregula sp. UBA64]|jgi:tRNA (pseudouridine54-N1)-methyltransferase|uniref:tRNA (pseudouridine(54)-N(1))-methyltransferase TrmY n=1 Tax=Methanoregula sp. UBA64 TaxID=1915554 RepID=UPI0025FC8757|nr:tRNA (pseudouridine(54)-N(1))-methyltransferase TrmY [Methanoregula sp. UBA64]
MALFAVVGHLARTDGEFSLNDLPGAGRMDVLCRCVNATLFLSHDLRRDAECCLVLLGGPKGPKTVIFRGDGIRSLSPDERSAGALIKKALSIPCGSEFREAAPGVFVRNGGLERLFAEHPFAVLDEKGTDIRTVQEVPAAFLLSDHQNFTEAEEALIRDAPRYSVGPVCLHADHTITVISNEIDRRNNGWH